jgi:hypothetical protein
LVIDLKAELKILENFPANVEVKIGAPPGAISQTGECLQANL